jgi:hypothetical protein
MYGALLWNMTIKKQAFLKGSSTHDHDNYLTVKLYLTSNITEHVTDIICYEHIKT